MNDGFFDQSEIHSVKTESVLPKCGACKLFKTCKSPKMEPSGKGKKKVLIVGEAPWKEDDVRGRHFSGPAGERLEKVLNKLGIDMRRDCHLTNAMICMPTKETPSSPTTVGYCRPNLINTIEELQPESIILLGGAAVQSILPKAWGSNDFVSINRWVGWSIPCQKLNAWLFPTYQPEHVIKLENEVLDMMFEQHLENAFSHKGRPFVEVPDYGRDVIKAYDKKQIIEFMDGIQDGIIAFDYETNRLKPDDRKNSKVFCCSVCHNGKVTLSFPMPADKDSSTHQSLAALLERKSVKKIAANMKFEDRWTTAALLKKRKVKIRNWYWDTMVAAHVLDCRENITGLKFQAFARLGQYSYAEKVESLRASDGKGGNSDNKVDKISWDELLLYNGLDSILEYLLADLQMRDMGLSSIL